tara:strand:- start:905 stop:1591 length:687 start_codon:yes stop_codon:yes gene_type:complete
MKKIKRLLIIPAKSKSKRIKNKNIKKFYNKPIIQYPIEIAKKSRLFSKIHVSTDDLKIINIVKKFKIKKEFLRPKSLSDSKTSIHEVIKFVVNKFNERKEVYDEIWCILPCSPLLKVSDLIQSSKIFNKTKADHLISISKFQVPIEWAFEVNKKDKIKILNPKKTKIPSNKLREKFFDAGMFYIYKTDKIFSNPKNYKIFGYKIPQYRSVDIDYKEDWDFAKKLFKIK